VKAPGQSLKHSCARAGAMISHPDLKALTQRQRQAAELRIAGLSLQAAGKRLEINGERVRQIEARLRSRAKRALKE